MKAFTLAAILTLASTSALAFPTTLECTTNEGTDSSIHISVKNGSVELAMHEMSFDPIPLKANRSKDKNTLAFDVQNTSVWAEGDQYKTGLELTLTYSPGSKKLSMALELTNKDLGVGSGGGFLKCR